MRVRAQGVPQGSGLGQIKSSEEWVRIGFYYLLILYRVFWFNLPMGDSAPPLITRYEGEMLHTISSTYTDPYNEILFLTIMTQFELTSAFVQQIGSFILKLQYNVASNIEQTFYIIFDKSFIQVMLK